MSESSELSPAGAKIVAAVEEAIQAMRSAGPPEEMASDSPQGTPPAYDDSEWTPEERDQLLREFGERADWDDPAMDAYDDPPLP
jgi:hypothetical protein